MKCRREGRISIMKKKLALLTRAAVLGLSVTACGSSDSGKDDAKKDDAAKDEAKDDAAKDDAASGDVANKDKPLVWFNRQPSNSSTGELDMTALNFNEWDLMQIRVLSCREPW